MACPHLVTMSKGDRAGHSRIVLKPVLRASPSDPAFCHYLACVRVLVMSHPAGASYLQMLKM